ncbi:MAG: CoA transferase [Deltaproteobacteria bacterium]|nr:MAG: CoA transferase [Deltaproteobacteria bacterium]
MNGLRDLRVIELSTGIAGGYATKLFCDAGADVVKVEPPGGDPLRHFTASGRDLAGRDAPLFQFLAAGKRSVIGAPGDSHVEALVAGAHLVVESFDTDIFGAARCVEQHPGLVVLSITPFGRTGPYAGRPSTEFTVQAECGSIGTRGLASQPPIMAGGRTTEWVGGTFAAVAALAAVRRATERGLGEHVDFSLLEVMNIAGTMYSDLLNSMLGRPKVEGTPARTIELPSIEPTLDGWVGFNTNSRQQYRDFLLLIERTDLLEDEELARINGRWARMDEWNAAVRAWTTQHTTAEIVERAALLRIPVAPVNDGRTVKEHEHFAARGVFVKNPSGGFLQPRPPYRVDDQDPAMPRPSPRLGEHDGAIGAAARPRRASFAQRGEAERRPEGSRPAQPGDRLPLDGIRVLDATAWWAGPTATGVLAALGADVIHLEAIQRPDGMRMTGGALIGHMPSWWEYSHIFLSANTNKRGLTLNLADARGLALAKRVIAACDVFVENFSPRVIEQFGLDWPSIQELNPSAILVRMPAFGLSGPWRDHVGFAQTMEQITGLAWLTGHPHDQPRIQRGPCDPLAGTHAAFATLVALAQRDRTGAGHFVECTMVEGALNAAAEQIVEHGAHDIVLQREGNRAPHAAPQNLYACRGREQWLALSVESDAQWRALVECLGRPAWALSPDLAHHAGRRAHHDRLDAELARWAADRALDATVAELVAAGVPAAPVTDPRTTYRHPQLTARGFYELISHPVVGTHPVCAPPFRFASVARWLRSPAPTLGEHNREILGGLLGVSDAELDELAAAGVIGTRPTGL